MTTDHQLPQIFGRVNKNGVPYVAVITAWLFGPLAYLSLGSGGASQAFTWLLNLSTVAGLIAWATLCFCYLRFFAAMKKQGISRDTLPWKGPLQPYTAWMGFILSTIITLIAGFPVFLKGNWSTSDFVASYVGIPIFIVPIICWKLWYRTKVCPINNCILGVEQANRSSLNVQPILIYGLVAWWTVRLCRTETRVTVHGESLLIGYSDFVYASIPAFQNRCISSCRIAYSYPL